MPLDDEESSPTSLGSSRTDIPSGQPTTRESVANALFEHLARVPNFEKGALQSRFQQGLSDQEFGLALHDARERLRAECQVEYISQAASHPGFYFRASEEQKLNRGRRFAFTALRKQIRAGNVLEAVNADGLAPSRRTTLLHARDRIGMAAVRAAQAMGLRRGVPTVCEVPEVPRRTR
jgi:hypothetical protein